jgi:tRNA pseudouridine32 synthase/23S rRNA pseudouridine746 synthase
MTDDIDIVLATDRLVVVDKPPGMLAVPGRGPEKRDCAASRVRARFPSATGPLVVHRLDMETSGLIVFGLDPDAQRNLSIQFEKRVVEKSYTALVEGVVEAESGVINLPIRADIDRRPIQIVDEHLGKPARTAWRVVGREIDRTRLRLEPRTGRTHQLRVHMASGLGRPIIGDSLYGGARAPRLMLHASWLSLVDPATGRRLEIERPAPF